jgi:hypothetical protein
MQSHESGLSYLVKVSRQMIMACPGLPASRSDRIR